MQSVLPANPGSPFVRSFSDAARAARTLFRQVLRDLLCAASVSRCGGFDRERLDAVRAGVTDRLETGSKKAGRERCGKHLQSSDGCSRAALVRDQRRVPAVVAQVDWPFSSLAARGAGNSVT